MAKPKKHIYTVSIKEQRVILSDFKRGQSMSDLAKKYAITRNIVEQIVRHWINK